MQAKKRDLYFTALAVLAAIYVIGWTYLIWYKYSVFTEIIFDLGTDLYSFYMHAFYPSYTSGLQALVFTNHLSVLGLAIVPIFHAVPTPITLVALQDLSLALASLLIYKIAIDISKNGMISFGFGLAFLINPGVMGISIYDFHLEGFMPLLCLLIFYSYLKNSKIGFVLSYALLLSLIDTAPFVGLALLAGFAFYEIRYVKQSRQQLRGKFAMLLSCLVITGAFMLFYHIVALDLLNGYGSGQYSFVPPPLRLVNVLNLQASALSGILSFNIAPPGQYVYELALSTILILAFGYICLIDPILLVIFASPWLFEVFILSNAYFINPANQYYAYGIGGAAIAALLCLSIIVKKQAPFYSPIRNASLKSIGPSIIQLSVILSMVFFVAFQSQSVVLKLNPEINYTLTNSALGTIPANSSVMAQPNLYTHLYYIKDLEVYPAVRMYGFNPPSNGPLNVTLYWFRPQYIVTDNSLAYFYIPGSQNFSLSNYMGSNYTLVNSTGGMDIYEMK
jgi:uncharacterized membrane protein